MSDTHIANSGYSNSFVLAGLDKKCKYITPSGAVRQLSGNTPNKHYWYHLSYNEAAKYASKTDTTVSFWLDNAQYNGLHIFVVDVDNFKENGKKLPIDTEAPAFKTLERAADIVTRSKSGGYHFYFGVYKERATPLFDSIGLLTGKDKPSLVSKTKSISKDGRLLIDCFCDVGHLIRETHWDCSKPLTDKTECLYRILAEYFVIKRTGNSGAFTGELDDAEGWDDTQIEGRDAAYLREHMTFEQQQCFDDLMDIDADCDGSKWKETGFDIYCAFQQPEEIFADELAGEVWLWWSKRGKEKYSPQSCVGTWNWIVKKALTNGAQINNLLWRSLLGLDKPSTDGKQVSYTALLGDEDFRPKWQGQLITWRHNDNGNRQSHDIMIGDIAYKPESFFKLIEPQYKRVYVKAALNGIDIENSLYLTRSKRQQWTYFAKSWKYGTIEPTEEQRQAALIFCDNNPTAKQIKRWIDKVGLNSVLTFGATPQKIDEPAKTWCHTEELKEDNSGILYYGISIQWKEILEYIAYKTRNGQTDIESRLKAMYWYKPKKCYMTYSVDDYNKLSSWIMAGCDMDNMPFSGETPNSELEFELLFENATFQVMQTVGERNRNEEIKERQKQGRALTKKSKDREEIMKHLFSENQHFTYKQLLEWGISRGRITTMKKNRIIVEIGAEYMLIYE